MGEYKTENKFIIGKVYNMLIAEALKVPWGNIMIKNIASPSARFITWLPIQNRLSIKDKVGKWIKILDTHCVMCNRISESAQHLFYDCPFAQKVRSHLLNFLQHKLENTSFTEDILKMNKLNKKKTDRAKLIEGVWTKMIYNIWMQSNRKIIDNRSCNITNVVKDIIFRVAEKVKNRMREMLVSK